MPPTERERRTTSPYSMRMADIRYDLEHGAPRRILASSIEAFTATLDPAGRYAELGAGYYDHSSFFPCPTVKVNIDPDRHPHVLADLHDAPFADGAFDGGLCISVLEHVHDPYQVVREWARITRPGGRVFAWIPFFFGVHGYPVDVSRFTDYGARQLFSRAGFEVETCTADPYRGAFLNLSDTVHFIAGRASPRPWIRAVNKPLFLAARLGFPLDRKLRLGSLYAGVEVVAVRA
jgi:SAM-dependent methyltransferase